MQDAQNDGVDVRGQDLNEVKSELAEIIILQRDAAHAETEKAAVQAYDVLIGKLLAHIKSRVKRTVDNSDDRQLAAIIQKFKTDRLESIHTKAAFVGFEQVVIIWIGSDMTTRSLSPISMGPVVLEQMKEQAYARLKERKIAMYNELMEIISDEFDLHRDLAHNRTDIKTLKDMTRRRVNGGK